MEFERLLLAHLGGQAIALPVHEISDVIETPKMTPVPLSAAYVKGILNLRGKIITSICMSTFLKLQSIPSYHNAIIIDGEEDSYCFLVDRIGEVVDYSKKKFTALPTTLIPQWGKLAKHVIPQDDKLILRLDVSALLEKLMI
jgi:purine-binding chemotaxis protein CheW